MDNKVDLDNDYFLEISDNVDKNSTNITRLRWTDIKKKKYLILKIDFLTFTKRDYKRILKKLLRIKLLAKIYKMELGTLEKNSKRKIGYLVNYDLNNKDENDFISGINAIFYNTRYERYNYIYDTVCDYLDGFFYRKNLCDFKNNQCSVTRGTQSTWGCCRHFKVKWLGPFSKFVICEYLRRRL